ncbi:phycobiliprotein lyase [Alkalinema pantanalense CENA528]|uniref:phycobiliprotein lyase n=1 Tax=Alkalinema pantanalense TaxID=1620705 RepID=UPI003D6F1685
MDIQEFFQKSAGRWSSIKSNHHVNVTQQQSGKSTLEMQLLEPSDAAIAQLCEKQGITPSQITCAARVQWDGFVEGETSNQKGSLVMAAIAHPEDQRQGKLLRAIGNFGVPAPAGEFAFGENNEITITTEKEGLLTVERIWYESDNVRLRHSKIHRPDGTSSVTFCSEVRLISAPAK